MTDLEWNKFLEKEFRKFKIRGVPITKAVIPKDWKSVAKFQHKNAPRYKAKKRVLERIKKEHDKYFADAERLEEELKLLGRKYGRR